MYRKREIEMMVGSLGDNDDLGGYFPAVAYPLGGRTGEGAW